MRPFEKWHINELPKCKCDHMSSVIKRHISQKGVNQTESKIKVLGFTGGKTTKKWWCALNTGYSEECNKKSLSLLFLSIFYVPDLFSTSSVTSFSPCRLGFSFNIYKETKRHRSTEVQENLKGRSESRESRFFQICLILKLSSQVSFKEWEPGNNLISKIQNHNEGK